MKRVITVFGFAGGLSVCLWVIALGVMMKAGVAMTHGIWSMVFGYTVMFLTFTSMIGIACKRYRDKFNSGVLSYKDGLKIGFGIALIGSLIYTLVWIVVYKTMVPDFMDKYMAAQIETMRASGKSQALIDASIAEMATMKKLYDTWYGLFGMTFLEIFIPPGLMTALLMPLFFIRKTRTKQQFDFA